MPPCGIFGMEECGKRWEMVDENGMSDIWVFPKNMGVSTPKFIKSKRLFPL